MTGRMAADLQRASKLCAILAGRLDAGSLCPETDPIHGHFAYMVRTVLESLAELSDTTDARDGFLWAARARVALDVYANQLEAGRGYRDF
jgi:hypothetical protein